MKHFNIWLKLTHVIILFSLLLSSAWAATCPTELMQQHQGYWLSHQQPGWKSNSPTEHNISVNSEQFTGVVYSPKRQRLACVYRTSDGKFLALISNKHRTIKINTGAEQAVWHYHKDKKDYSCGKPGVKKISGCTFQL
jgi:hypothetical protein